MDLHEELFGRFGGSGLSRQINTDKFYWMASKKFPPEADVSCVTKEADRLRTLAADIKELKDGGLI